MQRRRGRGAEVPRCRPKRGRGAGGGRVQEGEGGAIGVVQEREGCRMGMVNRSGARGGVPRRGSGSVQQLRRQGGGRQRGGEGLASIWNFFPWGTGE